MSTPRTASQVWGTLQTGNKNFMAGTPTHPRQDAELRKSIAVAQRPMAALFGCSDSRLGAEMIFDVGLGDLFVVRNAGQVIAETILGSLEFAVEVLEVPLIVVLGHDQCGAIKATMSSADGELTLNGKYIHNLVARIMPSVIRGRQAGETNIEELTNRHVADTIEELIERSEIISKAIASGKLAVVGANYRLELGEVSLISKRGNLETV
jgi:carbonic anhydrase